jgi:hypothetical protein
MLTLVEEAITEHGEISPTETGVYFLLWRGWLSDVDLERYASKVYQLYEITPEAALYPEWVLQQLDHAGSYAAGSERLWPQIYVISNT